MTASAPSSGRSVVGAGTHDIGFEKDQRNGKITHKIDPEVDGEREYIGQSLKETGQVASLDYLTPANPVKEAKTAHGAGFRAPTLPELYGTPRTLTPSTSSWDDPLLCPSATPNVAGSGTADGTTSTS